MTPISLYDGCFVKTDAGEVFGPVMQIPKMGLLWLWLDGARWKIWAKRGQALDGNDFNSIGDEGRNAVVSVYPSLAAASAANPGL